MASRRSVAISSTIETPSVAGENHEDVVAYYRRALAEPAVVPWAGTRWPPVHLGRTWEIGSDGHWVLPDATLGWDVLGFIGSWLQHAPGKPWRMTLEQARLTLWWFALDEAGEWIYHDGVLQRLKGWGKDPFLAAMCATELVGPARFAGWEGDVPIAVDVEHAWIPVAATALAQTRTTFQLFPIMFSPDALDAFGITVSKEMVYAYGDARMIQAVTKSPALLEGIRSTFTVKNETQHWNESNMGFEMAAVIERNATKSEHGTARVMAATNAPAPSEESVGLMDREAFELAESGGSFTAGIMYDSLEAAPDAPLAVADEDDSDEVRLAKTVAAISDVLDTVRGDSVWLNKRRIIKSILDTRNPPSRSRRFWYNQMHATEDAWVDPADFEAVAAERRPAPPDLLLPGDEITMFFDGSKSDDATGLVGARVSDGYVVTLGMWAKPPKARAGGWLAPRGDVDHRVRDVFATYRVKAFWADPSHTRDDETQERYWDALIDAWHRDFKDQLTVWAKPGPGGHAVMWDMTSSRRIEEFTAAAERCVSDIEDGTLAHDGDRRLINHVRNARKAPNDYGVSLRKEHRESSKKIDLAVCMVGARMIRRELLNRKKQDDKKRTGRSW